MTQPLVSIIIPCYNAEHYIEDTLTAALSQDVNVEIILIDDGSTDKTREKVERFNDNRIHYHFQKNQGVSIARNNGFKYANGIYTIFCDADDIMPHEFLQTRLSFLEKNPDVGFVSGRVITFNATKYSEIKYRGIDSDLAASQILLYDERINTCPSNYLFRSVVLRTNNLLFNECLSSTADRLFLLQASLKVKGVFYEEAVPLHYRISAESMSNKLSLKLVNDNELYYEIVKKNLSNT